MRNLTMKTPNFLLAKTRTLISTVDYCVGVFESQLPAHAAASVDYSNEHILGRGQSQWRTNLVAENDMQVPLLSISNKYCLQHRSASLVFI
jgi:hypothetical protein